MVGGGIGILAKRMFGGLRARDFHGACDIAWDDYYRGVGGSAWFRWLDAAKIRRIREACLALPSGSTLVDVGCGTGAILQALAYLDLRRIGIEYNAQLASRVRAAGVATVRADFDAPLPLRDRSIRLMMLVDTIEHVRSREILLSEARRVLADDGIFIAFTPPYDSLSWQLGESLVCMLTRRPYVGHTSPFTSESLAALLHRHFAEFEIDRFNAGLSLFGIGRRPRR